MVKPPYFYWGWFPPVELHEPRQGVFFCLCDAGGAGDEYFKNDKYPLVI